MEGNTENTTTRHRWTNLKEYKKTIEIVAFENVLAYQFFKVHFCSL